MNTNAIALNPKHELPKPTALASVIGSGATWKHKRGGKGDAAWQKWVSDELKAWVTWWKANPSVVHYGSNATYRGTIKATPDQAMREIELRQNEKLSHTAPTTT